MRRFSLVLVIGLATPGLAFAGGKKAAPAKAAPAKTAKAPAKPAPPKPAPMLSGDHKKAAAELMAGYKFGMSKDEVLGVLQKQIDAMYEDKIKGTTDVAQQDRFRKEKKADLARVSSTYTAFEGKKTGWDVSIIENEFAHNTNESMMEHWENQGGKNQRRFFFFYEGKLWKMFVSLDVSILPEDKKNFDTFSRVMQDKYGPGGIDGGTISWRGGEFDVRAVDRLKDYDALGIAIEDPHVRGEVYALRETKKPPGHETNAVVNAVIDKDNKDHPDIKANGGAVDAVIQAQGGGGTAPKK